MVGRSAGSGCPSPHCGSTRDKYHQSQMGYVSCATKYVYIASRKLEILELGQGLCRTPQLLEKFRALLEVDRRMNEQAWQEDTYCEHPEPLSEAPEVEEGEGSWSSPAASCRRRPAGRAAIVLKNAFGALGGEQENACLERDAPPWSSGAERAQTPRRRPARPATKPTTRPSHTVARVFAALADGPRRTERKEERSEVGGKADAVREGFKPGHGNGGSLECIDPPAMAGVGATVLGAAAAGEEAPERVHTLKSEAEERPLESDGQEVAEHPHTPESEAEEQSLESDGQEIHENPHTLESEAEVQSLQSKGEEAANPHHPEPETGELEVEEARSTCCSFEDVESMKCESHANSRFEDTEASAAPVSESADALFAACLPNTVQCIRDTATCPCRDCRIARALIAEDFG